MSEKRNYSMIGWHSRIHRFFETDVQVSSRPEYIRFATGRFRVATFSLMSLVYTNSSAIWAYVTSCIGSGRFAYVTLISALSLRLLFPQIAHLNCTQVDEICKQDEYLSDAVFHGIHGTSTRRVVSCCPCFLPANFFHVYRRSFDSLLDNEKLGNKRFTAK